MADEHPPPARNDLEEVYDALIGGTDEEMDEATAAAILAEHGVDPNVLADRFRARLEQEARGMEAEGVQPPRALLDALEGMDRGREPEQDTSAAVPPEVWLDSLLAGYAYDPTATEGSRYVHSFRERNATTLSTKDRSILDALAAELDGAEEA